MSTTDTPAAPKQAAAPSYARLLRARGITQLLVSALFARTATQMWEVAIVLFALQQFHSASLAGLSVFLLVMPGLLLSPVSGALLDRHGRRRLMQLDFVVAASALIAIAVTAVTHVLTPGVLLAILVAGSLTSVLSIAGARSLFPLLVPADLWDRANATDTVLYSIAQIGGPALAGGITAAAGAGTALIVAAAMFIVAAAALHGVREPATEPISGNVLRDARAGLVYVVRNRSLRWIGIGSTVANISFGIFIVALPVVVFRLHGGAALVGTFLALQGVCALPTTLATGRFRSEGRERHMMAGGNVAMGLLVLALLAPSLAIVGTATALAGAADAPTNVGLYSLRQRRTERAWFGRAFAVSMSLNFAGMPIGSALAGPLLAASTTGTICVAACLPLVAAALFIWRIPATEAPREAS